MKFLKENWFKLIAVFLLLIVSASALYYFIVNPHNKEKKKNECISIKYEGAKQFGIPINSDVLREIDSYCTINMNGALGTFNKIDTCGFELKDVKESRLEDESYWAAGTYTLWPGLNILYKGLIKNSSNKKQILRSMVAKIYTEDMTYLNEGYTDYNKTMEPGTSLPFEVLVSVQDEFKKEIIKKDIYPWFATCK